MKVKEGALLREDLDAVSHLKLWLLYQRHYCEHKPSVTISVQEHEWPIVGAKVWENFDEITGVSFLPMDGELTGRLLMRLLQSMNIIRWKQQCLHLLIGMLL